jgi:hypothetical protein
MPALLAAVAVEQFTADGNSVTPMAFTVRTGCTISAEVAVTSTFEDMLWGLYRVAICSIFEHLSSRAAKLDVEPTLFAAFFLFLAILSIARYNSPSNRKYCRQALARGKVSVYGERTKKREGGFIASTAQAFT